MNDIRLKLYSHNIITILFPKYLNTKIFLKPTRVCNTNTK